MENKQFIKTSFDLYTGCSICQLVCSNQLRGGYNPHLSVLRVKHECENLYHMPVVCNQCDNAYCMNVCPVGAISLVETTQAKVVDHEKCIGCGTCARYCPPVVHYQVQKGELQTIFTDPPLKPYPGPGFKVPMWIK